MILSVTSSAVTILMMVTLALMSQPTADAPPRPVLDAATAKPAVTLHGVWREVGYGRILRVHADGVDVYHETNLLCYRDEVEIDGPPASRLSLYDLSHDRARLTLYAHDLGSRTRTLQHGRRFDRIARLPAACVATLKTPDTERPEFIFDLLWQTFADHYAFFDRRNVDWNRARQTFRPRVRSDMSASQLFELFSEMLGPLNDGHVNLYLGQERRVTLGTNSLLASLRREFDRRAPEQDFGAFVAAWVASQKRDATALVGGDMRKAANDTIWWGHIDESIGYVNIYNLTGFTRGATFSNRPEQLRVVDEAFDEILTAFSAKDAILLDLTHNQGGFDAASALIAGRFADRPRHALTVQPFRAPASEGERVTVIPSERVRFTKPVFVLTSEVTVSAGEGLVVMLKAFPHVTHMGQRTRGYLSGILNKPLPASFAVSVTSQIITSPSGEVYEASGIAPEVPIAVFPSQDVLGGYPLALNKAVTLIRAELSKRQQTLPAR